MINNIKKNLKKRKVKIFLIFLICSGLAWFINKLSESYSSTVAFDLEFVNIPDQYLLKENFTDKVNVKLRAVGFQFLGFNLKKGKIHIDLSKAQKMGSNFFIPQQVYRKQIDKQLPNSITLLETDSDTLFFDFYEVSSKSVPIESRIQLDLAQNYLLDGDLRLNPENITIKGPKNEIDTIFSVKTEKFKMIEVTSDFVRKLRIVKAPELRNTVFSFNSVDIEGKVARFSEKVIEVPVKVINLPVGMQIRTFPDKISLLCKGKIGNLKELTSSDFHVIADYEVFRNNLSSEMLSLELQQQPEGLHSVKLLENQVEYILRKE